MTKFRIAIQEFVAGKPVSFCNLMINVKKTKEQVCAEISETFPDDFALDNKTLKCINKLPWPSHRKMLITDLIFHARGVKLEDSYLKKYGFLPQEIKEVRGVGL